MVHQVPSDLVATPAGSNAYGGNCYELGSIIDQYTVASDGTLTFTGDPLPYSYTFGQCIYAIAITPAGNTIASVWANADSQGPADNFILLFGLDFSTHKLNPTGPTSPAIGVGRHNVLEPS